MGRLLCRPQPARVGLPSFFLEPFASPFPVSLFCRANGVTQRRDPSPCGKEDGLHPQRPSRYRTSGGFQTGSTGSSIKRCLPPERRWYRIIRPFSGSPRCQFGSDISAKSSTADGHASRSRAGWRWSDVRERSITRSKTACTASTGWWGDAGASFGRTTAATTTHGSLASGAAFGAEVLASGAGPPLHLKFQGPHCLHSQTCQVDETSCLPNANIEVKGGRVRGR